MYLLAYYLVSAGLLTLLISYCRPAKGIHHSTTVAGSDVPFLGLALLVLLVMRLPSILYNSELNPDESQTLSNAITLAKYPVYGRLVDGTTLGPVNAYLLLIPRAFGLPIDYTSARLMALLLISFSLVMFYITLLRIITPTASRLTLLIPVVFFGWSISSDYLHYSSELTSLAIITTCAYLVIRLFQARKPPIWMIWSVGIIAGITPYCKLQTLPIVGIMLLVTAWYLIQTQSQALRLFCRLSVAFLVPSFVVFSLAYWFHVEQYFVRFYFIGNLATYSQIYADMPLTHQNILVKLLRFPLFSLHNTDFFLYVLLNSLLILGTILGTQWSLRRPVWSLRLSGWPTRLLLLTTAGTLWAVTAPGTEFGHHLVLLVFPMGWLTGLGIQYILNTASVHWMRWLTGISLLLMSEGAFGHLLLPLVKQSFRQYRSEPDRLATNPTSSSDPIDPAVSNPSLFWFPNKTKLTLSPVTQTVRHYVGPQDKIAVWGWNCQYYVENQLVQGVSESHAQRSIIPNQMRDEYLRRYAHELLTNQPAIFLDAVGKSSPLLSKPQQRHEHFPSIDRIIAKNYTLVDSVEDVRIFIRRDRLISRGLLRTPRPPL